MRWTSAALVTHVRHAAACITRGLLPMCRSSGRDGASRDEKEVLRRQKEEQHRLKMQLEDLVASLKASSTLIYSNLRDQNQVGFQTGPVIPIYW